MFDAKRLATESDNIRREINRINQICLQTVLALEQTRNECNKSFNNVIYSIEKAQIELQKVAPHAKP
jgi:hypothetical protein